MGEEHKSINKPPHVLVLPYPITGHINPMLQFCKRLVQKGVKTTLVTTVYISKSMHVDQDSPIAIETISDGYDEGGYAQAGNDPAVYVPKFFEVGPKTLANLIRKLNGIGNRVDAIVYDGFLPWALDVAKQLGIVGAFFSTQSCAVTNIYYHVYHKLIPLPLSTQKVSIPGLPELEPYETPSFVYIYGSLPAIADVVFNQFINIDKADWVFLNSFYKLEDQVFDWMAKLWRARTIGPTIPSMYLDKRLEDDKNYGLNIFKTNYGECMNWLNEKPKDSVVYVSFGSMAELESDEMAELAWGLYESNYNFLWVVRATEESKLPKEFMDKKAEKGLIVTWSPQLEVLAHESVGCFVTHCGFNSVLEAIGLGVPMVTMPRWTDQSTNAKYVEDIWCIGLRTKPDENGMVRRENLVSCIKEIMEGERGKEIKKNSIKWSNLAKEAVDEGGSSDKSIDEFVAELNMSI